MHATTPSRDAELGARAMQRGKLYIAMVVLLIAIVAIMARDGNWFSSDNATQSSPDGQQSTAMTAQSVPVPATPVVTPAAVTPAPTTTTIAKPKSTSVHKSTSHQAAPKSTTKAQAAQSWGPATPAAEHVRISSTVEQAPVPQYPLLTGSSNVQGSVLMQALIGVNGVVQELRVISGPAILVSAARQAVQQWHFKPYLVNGKPVETQARVTVAFTISVSNTVAHYRVDSVAVPGAL